MTTSVAGTELKENDLVAFTLRFKPYASNVDYEHDVDGGQDTNAVVYLDAGDPLADEISQIDAEPSDFDPDAVLFGTVIREAGFDEGFCGWDSCLSVRLDTPQPFVRPVHAFRYAWDGGDDETTVGHFQILVLHASHRFTKLGVMVLVR